MILQYSVPMGGGKPLNLAYVNRALRLIFYDIGDVTANDAGQLVQRIARNGGIFADHCQTLLMNLNQPAFQKIGFGLEVIIDNPLPNTDPIGYILQCGGPRSKEQTSELKSLMRK